MMQIWKIHFLSSQIHGGNIIKASPVVHPEGLKGIGSIE